MKQLSSLILLAALAGCFGTDAQKTGKEGKPLPEFSILLTDSTTWLNTHNIPAGKPFALFYFSPDCPYCKAQTQDIIEEMDELKNIQFYFISNYPIPRLNAFNKAFQLMKYPNIIIGEDTSQLVRNYFGIDGVPYIAIYDKNKNLNKTFTGKINSNMLKKVIED